MGACENKLRTYGYIDPRNKPETKPIHEEGCECYVCTNFGPRVAVDADHRPCLRVGNNPENPCFDFTDHSKEAKVDPVEWEIYSGYIESINQHKIWKAK